MTNRTLERLSRNTSYRLWQDLFVKLLEKFAWQGPKDRQELVVFPGKEDPEGLEVEREREAIVGPPGEPGKQGMKGDIGTDEVKGENGM